MLAVFSVNVLSLNNCPHHGLTAAQTPTSMAAIFTSLYKHRASCVQVTLGMQTVHTETCLPSHFKYSNSPTLQNLIRKLELTIKN